MATDNTTVGTTETFPLRQWESAIFLAVDCVLAVTIITGNTLVILSVLLERKLRTPTNAFIASLAVADLTVGLIVIPIDIAFALGYATEVTPIVCLASSNVDITFIIVSILHLAVIAYDRYLAITDPLSYVMRMSRVRIVALITAAWGTALLISSMPLLGWNQLQNISHEYCDLVFVQMASYRLFSVSLTILFPLNCMLYFYFKMYRVAKGHMDRIAAQEATTSRRPNLRRDVKAAKTIAMILGFFLAAWTPATLISVIDTFIHVDEKLQRKLLIYKVIFYHIGYSNSMVNPIIYAFRNKDFRHSFLKLIGVIFPCECWSRRVRAAAGGAGLTGHSDQSSSVSQTQNRPAKEATNVTTTSTESAGTKESCHSNES